MKIERGPDPGPFAAHGEYKPYLQPIFRSRCAYCLTPDDRTGGIDGMTIDHFWPTSRYPHLRLAWPNLYYSCSVCNSHYKKGHPTADEEARGDRFVDPCREDPDDHFRMVRDREDGAFARVRALTNPARYTLRILRLNSRKSLRDFWRELDHKDKSILARLSEIRELLDQIEKHTYRRGPSGELDAVRDDLVRQLQQQGRELSHIRSRWPFPRAHQAGITA